jgi:hypothetical protein
MATVLVSCLKPHGLPDQITADKRYIMYFASPADNLCCNEQTVPLFRQSDAGLSLRRSGIDHGSVHVRFVVDKVTSFPQSTSGSPCQYNATLVPRTNGQHSHAGRLSCCQCHCALSLQRFAWVKSAART